MFQKASREKLRFDTGKGQLSVEDLWDLPLTSTTGRPNLDSIAQELNKQLKTSDTVSFVNPSKKTNNTVQLKFDIVKYIIDVRLAENNARLQATEKAERKEKLRKLINAKEEEDLQGKTREELIAMLDEE